MRPRSPGPRRTRQRFAGSITGLGTREGTRAVVGHWPVSPFGAFADVMLERADGHRVLLAPDDDVAEFVSATYVFDEVVTTSVTVTADGDRRAVRAGPLDLWFVVGGRTALGHLLRAVPGPLAESPGWARLTDPLAAAVLPGVRTVGTAGGGRREWYAARDFRRVAAARLRWDGTELGDLRPVDPPARFGFSSTPAGPSHVTVVSTVEVEAAAPPSSLG
ncbi:hypothetical protein ATJ97_2219 [Georgenia soli]|uniref:Uncharacterized protein n=1 Tax=Georgenia soli TaxID=638953 RepID=A0A2A9EM70_9MICO|nr:hypothetical protein [Georgenia soli]PFG39706.1 hypothetical protein ATJ97_2219 [Georgenia soli]